MKVSGYLDEAPKRRRRENHVLYIWSIQFKGTDQARHFFVKKFHDIRESLINPMT